MMKSDEQVFPSSTKTEGKLGTYTATTVGGLTKRELFAGLIFAGCVDNKDFDYVNEAQIIKAVEWADKLVKALEENK